MKSSPPKPFKVSSPELPGRKSLPGPPLRTMPGFAGGPPDPPLGGGGVDPDPPGSVPPPDPPAGGALDVKIGLVTDRNCPLRPDGGTRRPARPRRYGWRGRRWTETYHRRIGPDRSA